MRFRAWTVQFASHITCKVPPGIFTEIVICGMQETKIKFKSYEDRPQRAWKNIIGCLEFASNRFKKFIHIFFYRYLGKKHT